MSLAPFFHTICPSMIRFQVLQWITLIAVVYAFVFEFVLGIVCIKKFFYDAEAVVIQVIPRNVFFFTSCKCWFQFLTWLCYFIIYNFLDFISFLIASLELLFFVQVFAFVWWDDLWTFESGSRAAKLLRSYRLSQSRHIHRQRFVECRSIPMLQSRRDNDKYCCTFVSFV